MKKQWEWQRFCHEGSFPPHVIEVYGIVSQRRGHFSYVHKCPFLKGRVNIYSLPI